MTLAYKRLNNANIAAHNSLNRKRNVDEVLKRRKIFGLRKRIKAAKLSGNDVEVSAKMICRICEGRMP